jgi:hypothetical protein
MTVSRFQQQKINGENDIQKIAENYDKYGNI